MLRLVSLRSVALAVAAVALSSGPAERVSAEGSAGMIPGGSYVDSCKEITFDAATNLLYATCDFNAPGGLMAKGEPVRSGEGFNVSPCIPNSIFNDNGSLYCFTSKPWGTDHAIPAGSYRASCTRSRVVNNVLIAECDDSDDETHFAQLNLEGCKWGGDISNQQGTLRCEPAATANVEPIVKPVTVDPVVKPAIIPAITPVEPAAAAEGEADGKKKKRRRDRGERG